MDQVELEALEDGSVPAAFNDMTTEANLLEVWSIGSESINSCRRSSRSVTSEIDS
jgi:hypothetical protein